MMSTREKRERGLVVVAFWHVLLVGGYLLWAFLLPRRHENGGCDGLGWGCTPNPHDGALIVGIVVGIPAVGFSLVGSGVLSSFLASRVRSGWAAGTVGTFLTWVLAPVVVLIWLRVRH